MSFQMNRLLPMVSVSLCNCRIKCSSCCARSCRSALSRIARLKRSFNDKKKAHRYNLKLNSIEIYDDFVDETILWLR